MRSTKSVHHVELGLGFLFFGVGLRVIYLLRSFIATGLLILLTATVAGTIIILSYVMYRHRFLYQLMWLWARGSLLFYNVHVHIEGAENRPKEGCLYLFNHSSHFDILALAFALKGSHFGAKVELFSIPLFGRAMASLGVLQITRSDRDRVLQLYQDSISRVRAGESFILAAEGTRQPTPGVGAKFKGGPFIFAISGQFPIVPAVIKGAAECLPKGDLLACTRKFRHDVTIRFLPPVSTKGLTLDDRHRLQDEVQKAMTSAYNQV